MTKPLKIKPVKTAKPNPGAKVLTLIRKNTIDSMDELASLIEGMLMEGQTEMLKATLSKATPEESEHLTGLIYSCVVNPIVANTRDGKVMQSWLFAIPVLMIGDVPASDAISQMPGFERITTAIKKSGLVAEHGPLAVTRPYLYSAHELLNAEYSDVYKLSEKMLAVLRGESVPAKDLLETHPLKKVKNQKFPVLSLRYLVGAVFDDVQNEDCFLNPDIELSEPDDKALAAHTKIMEEALYSVIGEDAVASEDYQPTPFYIGLGLGLIEFYGLELSLGLAMTLKRKGLSEKTVKAIVSFHFDQKEGRRIQVGFVSKLNEDLVYGHSFKMEEVTSFLGDEWANELVLDAIQELTTEMEIIPGQHPVESCDDCGTPVYMTADGEFDLHLKDDDDGLVLPFNADSSRARVLH